MRYIYVYKLCDNLYSCMNKTVFSLHSYANVQPFDYEIELSFHLEYSDIRADNISSGCEQG